MAFTPSFPVRTIEDVQRLEELPLDQTLTVFNTYELFVNSAAEFGDKTAIRFLKDAQPGSPTITWSYSQLLGGIHQTANLLTSLGLEAGESVSILLPACVEYHLALWGGEAAGIVNPLNPLLSEDKLADLMQAANSRILIAYGGESDSQYWHKACKLAQRVNSLRTVLRVAPHDEAIGDRPELGQGMEHFQAQLETQPNDRLISGRSIKADDVAAYFHTGGTTGSPKLAIHTHGNQVFTAWACVKLQGISQIDTTINGYPLFHVAGVLPGALASLSAGVEMIIPTPTLFRNRELVANYWKLVDYHKVTSISAVPTALAALAAVPLDGADISTVTFCRTGAAPLPQELSTRFHKLFNLHIHESLGMTETVGITSITPPGVTGPIGCVGFPIPYARFRIGVMTGDGSLSGEEMPRGEIGMLLVKAPNVFPGYLDNAQSGEVFTEDGWLITGDLGWMDELGRLNLSGRAKDLIIRSGHNVDPRSIEDALNSHPAVELCAAVGEPNAYAGELPVAFVTLKPGALVTEQELLDYSAGAVDEAPARPKQVTIIEKMPQTNVGKIFKPELRRMACEQAVKRHLKGNCSEILSADSVEIDSQMDANSKVSIDVSISVSLAQQDLDFIGAELAKIPVHIQLK